MLLEGFTLVIKTTSKVFNLSKNQGKVARLKLLCGWGIPFATVALAAAIGFPTKRYMDVSPLATDEDAAPGYYRYSNACN